MDLTIDSRNRNGAVTTIMLDDSAIVKKKMNTSQYTWDYYSFVPILSHKIFDGGRYHRHPVEEIEFYMGAIYKTVLRETPE